MSNTIGGEEPRPRPIAPIHPDTITFEKVLGEAKTGQRFTYDELAKLVRKDMETQGDAVKMHIRSAENRLLNGAGMVFGPFHDEQSGDRGRERLDSKGILAKVKRRLNTSYRGVRKTQRIGAAVDMDELNGNERDELAAAMIVSRGAEKFTSGRGRDSMRRLVANSTERIPALQEAWKQLMDKK